VKGRLVIWGTAGHALVVADIVQLQGTYELAGFIDDVNFDRHGITLCGQPVHGGREQLPRLAEAGVTHVVFGFGDCQARLRLAPVVAQHDLVFATCVHPRAWVSASASLGAGTVVKAGATIDPDVSVGANTIVGAGVTIGHGCRIGAGVLLSGGVDLAGLVTVGDGAWIGTGSKVKDRVCIGAGALVGTGSVVVDDIPAEVVAYGVPARVQRARGQNDH
jgi:sugar O-acyltransferase (sialic acid O-acetyltransferase NeuD family)